MLINSSPLSNRFSFFRRNRGMRLLSGFLLLLCCALSSFSQGRPDEEKIEAAKVSFFTQKLNLTAEEAKIFWPIYNDYQREQNALRKARMQKMISFRKINEIEEMTDNEIESLIFNDFDFRQKELNMERRYYGKLKSNLSIKVVGKFYRAQEAFKRELLNLYRGGGNSRGGQMRPHQ